MSVTMARTDCGFFDMHVMNAFQKRSRPSGKRDNNSCTILIVESLRLTSPSGSSLRRVEQSSIAESRSKRPQKMSGS